MKNEMEVLKELQYSSGLFTASHTGVKTGYDKAWIRDTIYSTFALENTEQERAIKAYHAILDVLSKHEYKIDYAIVEKPKFSWQYIHARYNPKTFDEYYEEWGNKQNDAVGAFLFKIGELEKKGFKILRGKGDERIIQKLVYYLQSIQYWKDADNGMWEEAEEVHASSVGACVAGLKAVKGIVHVPEYLIEEGEKTLNKLLPKESQTKETDLALLSLIYPYNIISQEQTKLILKNVEEKLVREKGVIRYPGDKYYNLGKEAEWHFGLSWLSIIYSKLGNKEKTEHYFKKAGLAMKGNNAPELILANGEPNENTPLAWSQSMFLKAKEMN